MRVTTINKNKETKRIGFFFILTILFFRIALAQNVDALRQDIYSKLKCCKCEISFEKCDCKDAAAMKVYIGALLDAGLPKEEIFYKVAKKYSPDVIIDSRMKKDIENRLKKDAGDSRPEISVGQDSYKFGSVSKKRGKINRIFKIYNKGTSNLIVSNIRTSCGCISASLSAAGNKSPYFSVSGVTPGWQMIIVPGKFAELDVVLDLKDSSMGQGKQKRDVFVTSNDPLRSNITLRVEVDVGS